MKSGLSRFIFGRAVVTPFAGVWIEILAQQDMIALRAVTPFAGVWIEMIWPSSSLAAVIVTPFAGVWIEMASNLCGTGKSVGHPLRGGVD